MKDELSAIYRGELVYAEAQYMSRYKLESRSSSYLESLRTL